MPCSWQYGTIKFSGRLSSSEYCTCTHKAFCVYITLLMLISVLLSVNCLRICQLLIAISQNVIMLIYMLTADSILQHIPLAAVMALLTSALMWRCAHLVADNRHASIHNLAQPGGVKVSHPHVPDQAGPLQLCQSWCSAHVFLHAIIVPVELDKIQFVYPQATQGILHPL